MYVQRLVLCTAAVFLVLFSSRVHHLQGGCSAVLSQGMRWLPIRMLTPLWAAAADPRATPTSRIFLGFSASFFHALSKPSLTPPRSLSSTLPKPWSHFGASSKAPLHLGSHQGDGGVILGVPLQLHMWGSLPLLEDLVLSPCSAGGFENTVSSRPLPTASTRAEAEDRKLFHNRLALI